MSAAVKASARNFPALAVSVALHCSLLLPLVGGLWGRLPPPQSLTPSSVAFDGTSMEVDAPTTELAAPEAQPTAAAPESEVAVDPEPAVGPEPAIEAALPARAAPPPTAPKPRARPPASTSPPGASSAEATSASSGVEAQAGSSSPGTFGGEALAPGVRRLGYAFTHAIPPATRGDGAWRELPVGLVGVVRVELTIDAKSHVTDAKPLPPRRGEPPLPPVLERMVSRTVLLLRAGEFALSGSNSAGSELLAVEVRLRDEPPDEDPHGVVLHYDFDGATPGHPGRAYFRYDTGRAVEAKVTIVPEPR